MRTTQVCESGKARKTNTPTTSTHTKGNLSGRWVSGNANGRTDEKLVVQRGESPNDPNVKSSYPHTQKEHTRGDEWD